MASYVKVAVTSLGNKIVSSPDSNSRHILGLPRDRRNQCKDAIYMKPNGRDLW